MEVAIFGRGILIGHVLKGVYYYSGRVSMDFILGGGGSFLGQPRPHTESKGHVISYSCIQGRRSHTVL